MEVMCRSDCTCISTYFSNVEEFQVCVCGGGGGGGGTVSNCLIIKSPKNIVFIHRSFI